MTLLDTDEFAVLEEAGSPEDRGWVLNVRDAITLRVRSRVANLDPALERSSHLARPLLTLDPGELAVSRDVVVFAPRYYEGELYRFERGRSGLWRGPMTIDGCRPSSDAVHAVSFETAPSDEGPYGYYLRSLGAGGVSEVGVAHETLAVIPTAAGEFVHMATVLEEDKRYFVVQRIAGDGQLESVWIEKTLTAEMAKHWPRPRVLASAGGRRVVMLKRVDRWLYPEVRIYETDLD